MKKNRCVLLAAAMLLSLALTATAASGGPTGKFKVSGGKRLFITCAGKGKPTVVLETGLGGNHRLHWRPVKTMSKLLRTKVCAYDRWRTGDSDGGPGTHTIGRAASDLRLLLRRAKLKGPYVFSAQSMGGLVDREYARRYPKDVAGLVLFDTAPDDWDLYTGTKVFYANEALNVVAASKALRAHDNLGSKPVIVVKAGDPSAVGSEWAGGRDDFDWYWDNAQRKMATISSNSIFVIAAGTGHMIPGMAPALSEEAMRLVVQAARKRVKLPACAATKLPQKGGDCDATPVPEPAA